MKQLFLITLSVLFIIGCTSEVTTDENLEIDTTATEVQQIDDANAEFTAADTSSTGVYQEEVDENSEMTLQEALKANTENPSESNGGMSFCDCVKKQKELEKTMLETEDDDVFDKAMEELEAMKTGECKILFEGNQSTVEGKKAHEQKVKRCL
ncbi:MAG: hypothetical protein H6586_05420 [Flavobacteriales bacterium]|nr:hypothetical protein [Flavobacteriales bacterium]